MRTLPYLLSIIVVLFMGAMVLAGNSANVIGSIPKTYKPIFGQPSEPHSQVYRVLDAKNNVACYVIKMYKTDDEEAAISCVLLR